MRVGKLIVGILILVLGGVLLYLGQPALIGQTLLILGLFVIGFSQSYEEHRHHSATLPGLCAILCVAIGFLGSDGSSVWFLAVAVVAALVLFKRSRSSGDDLLKKDWMQTIMSSLLCILLGLLMGYLVMLIINPESAWDASLKIVQNFLSSTRESIRMRNFGNTLAKTVPLLMCSLSVLFAYKVGLFNIGAAGQYVAGAGVSLYCAIALGLPWWVCMLGAMLAGALLAAISGLLKATRNVNEVISGIMLNWICLYVVKMLLVPCQDTSMSETYALTGRYDQALIPSFGLNTLFNNHQYITAAVPLAFLIAILIWYILTKTKLGYELRATGLNKDAAKYAGMAGRFNIILTMTISGALAGLGASMYYLTDIAKWPSAQATVPGMGFNGIAAAFLGGLHPIGAVFSSFFIQHITDGGASITSKGFPQGMSGLISAVIIYMCAFVLFIRQLMNKAVNDRAAANHTKLVSETRSILHNELQDDFNASVRDIVKEEQLRKVSEAAASAASETGVHLKKDDVTDAKGGSGV